MNLTGTIHWGTLSQNSDIFLFLKLGIFSLILEIKALRVLVGTAALKRSNSEVVS